MVLSLVWINFDSPELGKQWKQNIQNFIILRYVQFWFLKKGLGIVSPSHFGYDSSRKMFINLYSINWPNLIARLPLLLEILVNMCIEIVC